MVVPMLGFIVMDEQALGMVGSVTVGGLLITTVFVLLTVPQTLVTSRVMVYVPGLVNKKVGFDEVLEVPFVK